MMSANGKPDPEELSSAQCQLLEWHQQRMTAHFAHNLSVGLTGKLSELVGAGEFADSRGTLAEIKDALRLTTQHARESLERVRTFQLFQSSFHVGKGAHHVQALVRLALRAVVGFNQVHWRSYINEVPPELVLAEHCGRLLHVITCMLNWVHAPDSQKQVTITWPSGQKAIVIAWTGDFRETNMEADIQVLGLLERLLAGNFSLEQKACRMSFEFAEEPALWTV
ncbi:hypothetical protein ACFL54_06765 [Planctomycetota bacterium]